MYIKALIPGLGCQRLHFLSSWHWVSLHLSNRQEIWRCPKGCCQVLLLWSDDLWMETQWRLMGGTHPFLKNLWFSLKAERRRFHPKVSLWLSFQCKYFVMVWCLEALDFGCSMQFNTESYETLFFAYICTVLT